MSKVAIIPLQAFLDAKADSELVAELAKSVERAATLKAFDKAIGACGTGTATDRGALIALTFLRNHIAQGKHV